MEPTEIPAQEPEQPIETPAEQPAETTPNYVTRDDLNAFAEALVSRLTPAQAPAPQSQTPNAIPDPYDDPQGYARYLEQTTSRAVETAVGKVAALLEQQQQQAQLLQAVGGEAASEYLEGLSREEQAAVLRVPGLAKAIKQAAASKQTPPPATRTAPPSTRGQASSEGGVVITSEQQREIDLAYAAFAERYPVTKAEFMKIVTGGK